MKRKIHKERKKGKSNSLLFKKAVSCILAVNILLGSVPLTPFDGLINFDFNVFAANSDTAGGVVYPDVKMENGIYNINTLKFLEEYSQAYYSHPENHENDTLILAIGGEDSTLPLHNFFAIGTGSYPFKGRVEINSASNNKLNLPESFFDYVYDSVQIVDSVSGQPTALTISRISDNTGEPILAKHIRHDESNNQINQWMVNVKPYNDGAIDLYSNNGGILGEMEDGARLIINETDTNQYTGVETPYIYKPSGNVGRICGTMGNGAELTVMNISDAKNDYNILTNSGHAGGVVGSMGQNSRLILGAQMPSVSAVITAAGDGSYAGGIVGCNNGGKISFTDNFAKQYVISNTINGANGAGGISGCYSTAGTDSSFDISDYQISCKINGGGNIGGLFGELKTDHDFTIRGAETNGNPTTTITSEFNSGTADNYGGLVGSYQSKAETPLNISLTVESLISIPKKSGTASCYGGGIGLLDDNTTSENKSGTVTVDTTSPVYVKFNNFQVSDAQGANGLTFGGLVAKADYSFVDAKDVVIGVNGNFKGGAAVGSLANGVLKLSGNFNISEAKPSTPGNAYYEGKIVGYRDNALIYADEWFYSGNDAAVDNIGSWGDIIVFDGTRLVKSDVLAEDSGHTITLKEPSDSIAIRNEADYAITALAFQLDSKQNKVLTNDNNALTFGNIEINGTVNLTGTGLRGITRDNAVEDNMQAKNCTYEGKVSGNNNIIILDIENVGSLPVYRHKYNGMFAFVKNTVVEKLKFGTSENKGKMNLVAGVKMYAGSLASEATGTFAANTVEINTAITAAGESEVYVGGLLGNAASTIGNISVSDSIFKCNITDNNTHKDNNSNKNSCFGGVIGRINHYSNKSITWNFTNLNITGNITSNTGSPIRLGGLIAVIDQHTGVTDRSLNLTNVNVNGLTLSGTGTTMGGLLGYSWLNVNTTFHNVNATGSNIISDSTNNAKLAGLVYQGTGHWVVEKTGSNPGIKIDGLTVDAEKADSFGMIVNQGKNNNDTAIFLEIKEGAYVISSSNFVNLKSGCVFDEIVAYSANGDINANGQGVVSINVGGLKMYGTSGSNTYNAQTERGKIANRHTRYYYNLDTIREKSSPSDAEKLMIWALSRYAHSSISTYFTNSFSGNVIPNKTYDMRGYSWYPVDVNDTVTVNGTFIFYNSEFEGSEAAKTSTNHFTSLGAKEADYTQHHLMQNGLFRDVTGTLNVGNVTLQGNVGTDDYGSGALVWGTLKGSSASSIATVKMADNGKITLDGIYVHDLYEYNPLLINKISSYSTVSIGNVSNTDVYKTLEGINKTDTYPKAATSLIGQVGKNNATNINIGFDKIKLDGRKTEQAGNYDLNVVYNTDCSLFTHATLLESFQYDSGSSGIYNYTYDEDWGTDNPRNVTYGSEISDSIKRNQYFGEEFWYYNQNHESGKYTNYNNAEPVSGNGKNESGDFLAPHDFSGFLPYVYIVSTADNVSSEKNYQLAVNHAMQGLTGCGTYNDPYLVPSGEVLSNIAKLLNGDTTISINLPNLSKNNTIINGSNLQSKTWDDYGCTAYIYDTSSTKFRPVDGDGNFTNTGGYTPTEVRKYVAGAYFKLADNIKLDSEYIGLGNTQNREGIFRGIIIGDGYTITNKSSNPLIHTSYGSVVKNIRVVVENDNITLEQIAITDFSESGCKSYGAVIGQILGGDNIIDNVSVGFGKSKIALLGTYANLIPVGGYVGVVVYGSLIFRNMPRDADKAADIAGIPQNSDIVQSGTETDLIKENNTKWLYVNPIVGRVINAAVFSESDAYRPFENGTREYIGENGATDTFTWVDGAVTMKNGMKNYSIADLKKPTAEDGSDRLYVSEYTHVTAPAKDDTYKVTVSIPDAQTLFILSLLVQGKMTTTWYKDKGKSYYSNQAGVGGYGNNKEKINNVEYDTYKTTHSAGYNYVGSSSEKAIADNAIAVSDSYTIDSNKPDQLVPYFVRYYTKPQTVDQSKGSYSVFSISNGGTLCYMTFGNAEDTGNNLLWYMPDGFKGLGCIYKISDKNNLNDLTFTVNNLEGNNHTISLNMSLKHYTNGNENYMPSNVAGGAGFGFFNTLRQNRRDRGGFNDTIKSANVIRNLTFTGSVNYDVYGKDGVELDFNTINYNNKSDTTFDYYINVGTFAGHFDLNADDWSRNCVLNMENIMLQNVEINGVNRTGGFFGRIQSNNNTYNAAYVKNCTADNLVVTSGVSAGGFAGVINQYSLYFDGSDEAGNNGVYDIDHIVTYAGTDKSCGTGGIIGYFNNNEKSEYIAEIKNIDVGTKRADIPVCIGYDPDMKKIKDLSYIRNYDYSGKNRYDSVGGLIGLYTSNMKNSITVESCNVFNTNLYGNRVGGVYGACRGDNSSSSITIINTVVESSADAPCVMYGHNNKTDDDNYGAGGFIGYTINMKNAVTIQGCKFKGYHIYNQKNTGGIIGRLHGTDTIPGKICDTEVSDVKIITSWRSGSLVGHLSGKFLDGYNILTDNIQFQSYTTPDDFGESGYIVGWKNDDNNCYVKIAGFTRQHLDGTPEDGFSYLTNMMGQKYQSNNYYSYGTNGYVIFADYEGKSLTNGNPAFSTINDDNNVKDFKGKTVTDNVPYITSSPKQMIDAGQFLTGDGVNGLTYANSAIRRIIEDAQKTGNDAVKGAYSTGYNAVTSANITSLVSILDTNKKYSDYQSEMKGQTGTSVNFPVLILDDTNKVNSTALINNYLRMLTNTGFDFARGTVSSAANSGSASKIFTVKLGRCIWDNAAKQFKADFTESCLKKNGTYIYMGNEYDNVNMNGQFSLIDVQFLNPTDTTEVAYHLYVPVLVKKMLKYNFEASMFSGTNYRLAPYAADRGNRLIENLGNPMTLEVRWTYNRTIDEWIKEVCGGENLLRTYNKKIEVIEHKASGLPSGTKMVLIDANNNNQAYYATYGVTDNLYTTTGSNNYLNLDQFSNNGNKFNSRNLNDFFIVTTTNSKDDNKFVKVTVSGDNPTEEDYINSGATIRDTDGNYYRPYNEDSDGTTETVGITLAFKDGYTNKKDKTAEELQALPNFVEYLAEDYYVTFYTTFQENTLYHYEFTGPVSFEDTNYPSRFNIRNPAHLYTGDIYTNDFTITNPSTKQEISLNDNRSVGATFNAKIALTNNVGAEISPYLGMPQVNIFQSFLIYLNRQDSATAQERAILSVPSITLPTFTVAGEDVSGQMTPLSIDEGTITSNYIELRNNKNLKNLLKTAWDEKGTVDIIADFTLTYNDTDSISKQFPTRDTSERNDPSCVKGTKLGGSSSISSNPASAASTRTIKEDWNDTLYYCTIPASAKLIYSSNDASNANGEFAQFGINARELDTDEVNSGLVTMNTLATYSVGTLEASDKAKSMKITITLSKKDNYGTTLPIDAYIKSGTLKLMNAKNEELTKAASSSTQEFVYIITNPKQNLSYYEDTQIKKYEIPVTFSVYTGNVPDTVNQLEGFEDRGLEYSNYMVKLKVELFYDEGTTDRIAASESIDHIIYTNSKIYSDVVRDK
ncbi:MAG: hypothetical protein Q4D76_00770 [Oscillospiraceae bacterium]|nr:hypothetical protein [Oscillospiraceae bacterium]